MLQQPRPALLDFIYSATNATADNVADWTAGFAADMVSCPGIRPLPDTAFAVLCCDFLTPLYWLSASE
jgi:hypothetical protein